MKMFEENFEKKQNYIETIINQSNLQHMFSIIDHIIAENLPDKRIETMKNLFKILNKLCYYSPKCCFECFNYKIMKHLDKIFSFAESLTKGNFFKTILFI